MSRSSSSLPARLLDAGRGLLTGVLSALRGVVLGLGVVLGGTARGVGCLLRGRRGEGLFLVKRGLLRVVQLPLDVVLMLSLRVVSAVQVVFWLEPPGRLLTGFEVARLRPIFGTGLDYAVVRVKEGPLGVLGVSGRAFVHGDVVFIPPGREASDLGLLVHELTHVWQHQCVGTAYLSEAIAAQWGRDGYDWRKAVAKGLRWEEFNPEQQAQFIEDAVSSDLVPLTTPPSPRARLRGWTEQALPLLEEALARLRAGRGAT
ncbi:DUF4157 domain-containing protein [Myxococcus sp. K15C18031901]|uniref:DUF4157 domain-containing protein n=1 Tax=Myxococcus dinghuensis TaxID=2906761 RepID=UPI0020A76C31|nr:DUF4157 domain-containing protein [Myxococcus dinghuensis]MCP3098359.1 DUF4157 domain-containing protein [Myxococcus dinghuensis]